MITSYKLLSDYLRRQAFLLTLLLLTFIFHTSLNAQTSISKPEQSYSRFGYADLGDSVEFVFGQLSAPPETLSIF